MFGRDQDLSLGLKTKSCCTKRGANDLDWGNHIQPCYQDRGNSHPAVSGHGDWPGLPTVTQAHCLPGLDDSGWPSYPTSPIHCPGRGVCTGHHVELFSHECMWPHWRRHRRTPGRAAQWQTPGHLIQEKFGAVVMRPPEHCWVCAFPGPLPDTQNLENSRGQSLRDRAVRAKAWGHQTGPQVAGEVQLLPGA